jgi:hypothetical protein
MQSENDYSGTYSVIVANTDTGGWDTVATKLSYNAACDVKLAHHQGMESEGLKFLRDRVIISREVPLI